MRILNERRIRDYPRIFLISLWSVILANMLLHQGWVGKFGGVIGLDFISMYSGGWLYKNAIGNLYDLETQATVQQGLFQSKNLIGLVVTYFYPPYAAFAHSFLTLLPITWAYVLWTLLSLCSAVLAVLLIHRFLLTPILKKFTPPIQLLIIVFSYFPFIIGFFLGQNNSFTLLILTCIVISTMHKKWFVAGILAGFLLYKPYFILGFLIVWLASRTYKALLGFTLIALFWIGPSILQTGLTPYWSYLKMLGLVMEFPYATGLISNTSPYALLLTSIPHDYFKFVSSGLLLWVIAGGIALAVYSWKGYKNSEAGFYSSTALALLYPFTISPHNLIHDLLSLTLLFPLWSHLRPSRRLLYLTVCTYLGPLILFPLTSLTRMALLAIIPIGLLFFFIWDLGIIHKGVRLDSPLIIDNLSDNTKNM